MFLLVPRELEGPGDPFEGWAQDMITERTLELREMFGCKVDEKVSSPERKDSSLNLREHWVVWQRGFL